MKTHQEKPEVDGPADAGDPGAAASTPTRTPRPTTDRDGATDAGDAHPSFTTETGADKTSTKPDAGSPG